jgi:hypothetical protein
VDNPGEKSPEKFDIPFIQGFDQLPEIGPVRFPEKNGHCVVLAERERIDCGGDSFDRGINDVDIRVLLESCREGLFPAYRPWLLQCGI